MALRSVIDGFRILGRKGGRFRVVFVSDSQYLVRGMRDWVYGWMTRGWRRKAGVIENLELWKNAVEVTRQHQVDWRWVRGHEGHPQNEYANFLAMRAARDLSDSGGPVPSEFDSWLARERLGGRMAAEPDPFPLERDFKPARPLPVVTNTLLTS
jgi:ribonuclease HI